MGIISTILLIYGLLCLLVGILKLPAIWKMKKLVIMAKMFGGEKNLQIFIIVWGALFVAIALIFKW